MMNTLIEYANSAGDRWAAWVVATSVDAAVLLALVGLLVARHPQAGRAAGGLLFVPAGSAQVAGARRSGGSGRHGAMDSFGHGVVMVPGRSRSPSDSKVVRRSNSRTSQSRRSCRRHGRAEPSSRSRSRELSSGRL